MLTCLEMLLRYQKCSLTFLPSCRLPRSRNSLKKRIISFKKRKPNKPQFQISQLLLFSASQIHFDLQIHSRRNSFIHSFNQSIKAMKAQNFLIASTILFSLFSNSIYAFPQNFFPKNITNNLQDFFPNFTSPAWGPFYNLSGCQLGDQINGLSKLKQYFSQFGYFPPDSSSSNFTDDFDDYLETALKTYQLNFNLNATGVLDESTLNQIVRPRCGNADIINGTSSMNSGKSQKSIHAVAHYSSFFPVMKHRYGHGHEESDHENSIHAVKHYSFFPGSPKWKPSNRQLSYAFLRENQLTDTVKSIFARAFARWSAVTPLTFVETEFFYSADITIGFFEGNHGDGEPFDGVLGTLAHAFSPPNGRFHLDGVENWVIDGDENRLSSMAAIDLESVAVHEIGHLLGLGHSSVEESIMYPTISSGRKKVDLASDDVVGIQTLYGSNPYSDGTTSTTQSRQERDASSSAVHRISRSKWGAGILMVFAVFFLQ